MHARLQIRKGIVNVQGRNRPVVQIQAEIASDMREVLSAHFISENLFKRSSYASGLPAGVPVPSPSLSPHLNAMLKSDQCPEITVKTILAGQNYQANGIWDLMAFEYIAKRAFDALLDIMACVNELQTETSYGGQSSDMLAFAADMGADVTPIPAPVAPGAPPRLAAVA